MTIQSEAPQSKKVVVRGTTALHVNGAKETNPSAAATKLPLTNPNKTAIELQKALCKDLDR